MIEKVKCALCGTEGEIDTHFNEPPFVICEFCYLNLKPQMDTSNFNKFYVEG